MMNHNKMEDPEIISRIKSTNDPYWFGILYDRYVKIVYNKCLFLLQNKTEAEDITHDIFLKVFISLQQFKGLSSFKTWLLVITYNFCISFIRKRTSDTIIIDDVTADATDEINDNEFLQIRINELESALKELKPEEKMILFMKYQDEMSIVEIADALLIGESAVKMRLKRTKNKVMKLCNI